MHEETSQSSRNTDRPQISGREESPEGQRFVAAFEPGQSLPEHTNPSRIRITSRTGSGMLSVEGLGVRVLEQGESVQLEAGVPHALQADRGAWLVEVQLLPECCPSCS